jgi:hypothetical protein
MVLLAGKPWFIRMSNLAKSPPPAAAPAPADDA